MANFFDQFDAPSSSGNFFDQFDEKPEAPKPERGLIARLKDTGLSFASGATSATKAIADAFGASNAVSDGLQSATESLDAAQSPAYQAQRQQQAQRMRDAEQTGSAWEEVKAGVQNFADSPIEFMAQGAGSIVPTALAALASKRLGISPTRSAGTIGATQGAGAVKGSIYDDQVQRATEAGLTPEQAQAQAGAAQSYTGANADQIALGAGLGVLAGTTGVERMLGGGASAIKNRAGRTLAGMATEAVPEAAQGGQERLAANIAAQREGYDAPTWQGVGGQATTEALASAGPGGLSGFMTPHVDPSAGPLSRAAATAQQTGAAGLAQAAQQAQAAEGDTQAAQPDADPLAGLSAHLTPEAMRAVRTAEGYGPESVNEVLRTYQIARNPELDPTIRQQATEALNGFWQGFDAQRAAEQQRILSPKPDVPPAGSFSDMNEFADFIAQERADLEQRRNPPPFEEMKGVEAGFDPMSRARNQVPPASGSFGAMNEFADLLGQEQADVQQRRDALGQTQGLQRDSRLESIGNEIDANRQQQTAQARLSLLDQLDADPETVNLLPRFESMLKKQGYAQRRATPEERELIARRMDARAALVNADQEAAAPNELDAAAMGIRERQPKVRQPQPAPAEKPARAAFPMTQTGAQRQAAERTQATGQAFEAVPHPTVKGRFAVQPVATANTSPERVAETPENVQVAQNAPDSASTLAQQPTNALLNAGEIGTPAKSRQAELLAKMEDNQATSAEIDEYISLVDQEFAVRRSGGKAQADQWFETPERARSFLTESGYQERNGAFEKNGEQRVRIAPQSTGRGGVALELDEFAPDVEDGIAEAAKLAGRTEKETRSIYRNMVEKNGKEYADDLLRKTVEKFRTQGTPNAQTPQALPSTQERGTAQQAEVTQKIAKAEQAGVTLSDADKATIQRLQQEADDLTRKADRLGISDPMNKGNAFPMGVGFTKMTKRKSQAIDSSVRRAGEAVKLYNAAKVKQAQVERMLSGVDTDAHRATQQGKKEQSQRELVSRLVNWKKGDKIGKFTIERVSKDKDGYPTSYTISGEGVIKGVMDKTDIARDFFGGDKEKLRRVVDEVRNSNAPEPSQTLPENRQASRPQGAQEGATQPGQGVTPESRLERAKQALDREDNIYTALSAMSGEDFLTPADDVIAVIKRATDGMTPEAKRGVNALLRETTRKHKDGKTYLSDPRKLFDLLPEQFAGVNSMLRDALNETLAAGKGAEDANGGFVTTRTVYGDTVRVRRADLDGDRALIPMFTADGKPKFKSVHRENLDPDGSKQAAQNAEAGSLDDVVTAKNGKAFANKLGARREQNRRGLAESHDIVPGDEVQAGLGGFVLKRKAAEQPRSDLDAVAERVTEPTHADPGQAPEAATAPVIREAIQKSARNTEFNAKEAKAWLLAEIDRAITDAPTLADKGARYAKDGRVERANGGAFIDFDKAIGFVTLDVPGDGTFKVLNTKETLQRFRDKVSASPGFRDNPTTGMKLDPRPAGPTKKEQADAITKAVKEGRRSEALDDLGNAIEIARLHGANDDPLMERFREIADKDYDAWRAEQDAEGEIAAREAGQSATLNSPEPRAEQGQQADTGADTATAEESSEVATKDDAKQPQYDYIQPSKVESTAQGMLVTAREHKKRAYEQVRRLRQQIKDEPLNGNRSGLRLDLLKAEDRHNEYRRMETSALEAIEQEANRQGKTTIKRSFAGESARTADTHALATAQSRIAAGEDAEAVRQETGWHKAADGRWRFEIDDSDATILPAMQSLGRGGYDAREIASVTYRKRDDGTYDLTLNPPSPKETSDFVTLTAIRPEVMRAVLPDAAARAVERNAGVEDFIGNFEEAKRIDAAFTFDGFNALPLDQVIDHPALFAAYPALREVMVQVDPKLGIGGAFSLVEHADGTMTHLIRIGKGQQLSTLLHEIQHGIQDIEGFASGGTARQMMPENSKEILARRQKLLDEITRIQDEGGDASALWDQLDAMEENPVITAEDRYRRLAGETEARNTQARQKLTAAERRARSPEETADVKASDVIVVFNGTEMASAPAPANAAPMASTGTTPEAIWSAVESLVGPLRRRRIIVVQSADVLVEQGILQSRDANGAQAFVKDGKAYFIASNIQPGNERAVFLHEVGAHLGMEKILSPLQRSVLLNRIKTWAAQANGSPESRIAQAALRRVEAAGVADAEKSSELLAYFVEEAVKAGINPTTDTAGPIGQWFKTLWNALRTALEKLGLVNASKLTAQDVVNLAHGAANVAMGEEVQSSDPRIQFSRAAAIPNAEAVSSKARDFLADVVKRPGTFGVLSRTLQTQYHKATKNPQFKAVWTRAHAMFMDASRAMSRPADLAPDLLPKFDLSNMGKAAQAVFGRGQTDRADIKAVADVLSAGTLAGGAGPMEGVVWNDKQLTEDGVRVGDKFVKLTAKQLKLYKEARAAIDASLDESAAAEAWKLLRRHTTDADMRNWIAQNPQDAPGAVADTLATVIEQETAKLEDLQLAAEANPSKDADRAIAKQQAVIADLKDTEERTAAIFDKAATLKEAGYMPLMRFGQFRIAVTTPDGKGEKIAYVSRYESAFEANRARRQLMQDFPASEGFTVGAVEVTDQDAWKQFKGVSPETVMLFAKESGIAADEVMQAWYKEAVASRSSLRRMVHRKGYQGFSDDLPRVLASFITSNGKAAGYAYHLADMQQMMQDETMPGDVHREARELLETITQPTEKGANVRGVMASWYLLGSIASAIVNSTQTLTMSLPFLSQFGSKGFAPGEAMGHLSRAYGQAFGKIKDKALADAVKRAEEAGIVDSNEVFHLYAEAMKPMIAKLGSGSVAYRARAFMTLWGAPFAIVEKLNRKSTFIAAYTMAKAQGKTDAQAFDFGERAVTETQGIYAVHNRPNWARGAVGGAILTFRQFSIAYLELASRMWQSGPEGKKAAGLMLGILFLTAGLSGLPGEDDLLDLIDTFSQTFLGKSTVSKMELRNWLNDTLGKELGAFVNSGVSAFLPLDVSGRMGMGNLLPGTALFKPSEPDPKREMLEVLGVPGSFAMSAIEGAKLAMQGEGTAAIKAFAPKAVQDVVKGAEMLRTGEARDLRGRKIVDVGVADAFWQSIGFNPSVKAEAGRRAFEVNEMIGYNKRKESEIVGRLARGVADRDQEVIQSAQQDLVEWNQRNPETPILINRRQVQQRIMQLQMERSGRIVKMAPPELRRRVSEALEEE